MKKAIKYISFTIVVLAAISLYSYSVRHIVVGGDRFGPLTKPFRNFIEFPALFKQAVKEVVVDLPPFYIRADTTIKHYNNLDRDIYALNATSGVDKYHFTLTNLRNDSIIHSWVFLEEYFSGDSKLFPVAHPNCPLLIKDTSLVGLLSGTRNFFRLDKGSKIIWINHSQVYHHSINLSHDGFVWACGYDSTYTANKYSGTITEFVDDLLIKVSLETGKIVWSKSVASILIQNGYTNLVHGFGNEESPSGRDFFHLNDIEPILEDGMFWQKGDLLLSLRNRSMIILYRPGTNSILRIVTGPFLLQHDADVLSDGKISIFNNNRTATISSEGKRSSIMDSDPKLVLKSSNVLVYDFADSSFFTPNIKSIEREQIFTARQGVHRILADGHLFLESTDKGLLYLIKDDVIIMRRYANPVDDKSKTEQPHWTRLYENLEFLVKDKE